MRFADHSEHLAGSTSSIGSTFEPLISPMTQFGDGDSSAPSPSLNLSNTSFHEDSLSGSTNEGWMSFVATGGWGSPLFQTQTFRTHDDPVADDASRWLVPTESAESSWDDFLSGPNTLSEAISANLQQVIELEPLPGSSLALIATLWSVSAESTVEPGEWSDPSGGRAVSTKPSETPPAWAGFVIGLDEAFEQSRGNVRDGVFSRADARPMRSLARTLSTRNSTGPGP